MYRGKYDTHVQQKGPGLIPSPFCCIVVMSDMPCITTRREDITMPPAT